MPLVTSDDPDYLAGLDATVAVEQNANSAGPTDLLGAPWEDYEPVAGLEAVPCRICRSVTGGDTRDVDDGVRTQVVQRWTVLFGAAYPIDRRHRLRHVDPGTGLTRYLYLQGPLVNAHMMNHHWTGDAYEFPQ
jgi:hypothetical protein